MTGVDELTKISVCPGNQQNLGVAGDVLSQADKFTVVEET